MADSTVTHRIVATVVHPEWFAEHLRVQREESNRVNVAKWRAWLAANLDRVLAMSDSEVSEPHLVVWLFPIGKRSRTDPEAPFISRGVLRETVLGDPTLRDAMRTAFGRVMAALGIEERAGALVWRQRPLPWALGRKHDRRVYRILRSLHSAGLDAEARKLLALLERDMGADAARAEALAWYRHQLAS